MYITRCVSFAHINPRQREKLEKEAPNEPFLITDDLLTRLKEEDQKKDDDKKWNCRSTPFHFLPISASLGLLEWTLGDLINHVFGPKSQGRTFGFLTGKKWIYSSSSFDFKASTFVPGFFFTTPEMWLRKKKRQPKTNSLWQASSRKRKERSKRENEREKERKKKKEIINQS